MATLSTVHGIKQLKYSFAFFDFPLVSRRVPCHFMCKICPRMLSANCRAFPLPVVEVRHSCCRHDSRSSPRRPNGSVRRCTDGLPRPSYAGSDDAPPLQMIRRAGLGRGARSSAANPSSCSAAACSHSAPRRHGRWAAAYGWLVVVAQVMRCSSPTSRLFVMQNGIYHFPCSTLSHFGFLLHSDSRTLH